MSHLPLDARAILEYLNELGFRNVSSYHLKEFMKDLRKLIKYEERMGVKANQPDYFEQLFKRTTLSYRAKIDKENIERNEAQTKRRPTNEHVGALFERRSNALNGPMTNSKDAIRHAGQRESFEKDTQLQRKVSDSDEQYFRSSPTLSGKPIKRDGRHVVAPRWHKQREQRDEPQLINAKATNRSSTQSPHGRSSPNERQRRSPSNDRADGVAARNRMAAKEGMRSPGRDRQYRSPSNAREDNTERTVTNPKGRRRRSKSRNRKPKSDPVALYHYYEREWRRFRDQIPGENSHSKIRWDIHERLAKSH